MNLTRRMLLAFLAFLFVGTIAYAENGAQTIFTSSNRTVATYNSADQVNRDWKGLRVFTNITAETGASTLDLKVQVKDRLSGTYFDLPGASFAQADGTEDDDILIVYPGVAETANESVSDHLGREWRLVAVVGGTAMTFSATVQLLE